MQLGARRTGYGPMGALWLILCGSQPVLHIHASLRAFEYDMAVHADDA